MKALMICGNNYNQRALANKLNQISPLAQIAIISMKQPATAKTKRYKRIINGLASYPLSKAWGSMLSYYAQLYPHFPNVTTSHYDSVNSKEIIALVKRVRPDIVLVSGTDLLRQPLIEEIEKSGAIMNLHTGVSPYIKGGPNCTNWALSLGDYHLIGNTIMWLDAGIDSGKIIATELTELTGRESLSELHIKVMNHGHDLYRKCYSLFINSAQLPAVNQNEVDRGRLFLTKHWSVKERIKASVNFYFSYKPHSVASNNTKKSTIRLVTPSPLQKDDL